MEEHILSQLQSASLRVQGILDESQRLLDELKSRRARTPSPTSHTVSEEEVSNEEHEDLEASSSDADDEGGDDTSEEEGADEDEEEPSDGEDNDGDTDCEVEAEMTCWQFFCCRR